MTYAMHRGLLTPQRVLIGLILLLVVSSLLPARYAASISAVPRFVVEPLIGMASQPLTWVSAQVRGSEARPLITSDAATFEENYFHMKNYVAALQQENEQLRREIADLEQVPKDIRRAMAILPARVVAGPRHQLDDTLTINRGRADRIEPNMVVTSGYNLVGLVSEEVAGSSAKVRLITSPTMSLSVTIVPPLAPPDAVGLPAKLRLERDGQTFAADARKQDQVAVGDLAHLRDESWPNEARGYIVGQVVAVIDNPDDPILRRVIRIRPRPDLRYLTQVSVLVPKEGG